MRGVQYMVYNYNYTLGKGLVIDRPQFFTVCAPFHHMYMIVVFADIIILSEIT